MANDHSLPPVTIPSVFITRSEGEYLINLLANVSDACVSTVR